MRDILLLTLIPLVAIAIFFLVGFIMAFLSKKPTRRGETTHRDSKASFKWALRGTGKALILLALWVLLQFIVFAIRALFASNRS
jgi:uncharacterized membrane protein